jgi:hypothetical protein
MENNGRGRPAKVTRLMVESAMVELLAQKRSLSLENIRNITGNGSWQLISQHKHAILAERFGATNGSFAGMQKQIDEIRTTIAGLRNAQ